GWRSIRRRDRLESRFFALRLSRGGLLGAAAVIPPSALRAAGPCRDGAETRRPTEHRAQDHAGSPALRPHFSSGIEARAGRRVLIVQGHNVTVRGRPLVRGGFCRIYPGQRILVGNQVLSYQELAQYFNAKKNVSLPQILIRVNKDSDEVELERSRTRDSSLRITFGLKVRV